MNFGYARCSTTQDNQDLTRQIHYLLSQGIPRDRIFSEYKNDYLKFTGALYKLLEIAPMDSSIDLTEADRWTRDIHEGVHLFDLLVAKRITLKIYGLTPIKFEPNMHPLLKKQYFDLILQAQYELGIYSMRVRFGVQKAKAKGVKIGRQALTADSILCKTPEFLDTYIDYKQGTITSLRAIGRAYHHSPATIKYWIQILDNSDTYSYKPIHNE